MNHKNKHEWANRRGNEISGTTSKDPGEDRIRLRENAGNNVSTTSQATSINSYKYIKRKVWEREPIN